MTADWARLVRAVVHGEFFLKSFEGEERGIGLFHAANAAGEAVDVHLLPADAPKADEFREHWSNTLSLAHPGLVSTLAFGDIRIDGEDFLCAVSEKPLEYLSDALAVRSLTADETREILESTLDALEHLHVRKYLHGSYGPASIVACGGRAKLTTTTLRPFSSSKPEDRLALLAEIRAVSSAVIAMLSGPGTPLPAAEVPPEFAIVLRTASTGDEKWSPTAVDLRQALEGVPGQPDDEQDSETVETSLDEDEPQTVSAAVIENASRKPVPSAHVVSAAAALITIIALTIYFAWPASRQNVAQTQPARAVYGSEASQTERAAPVKDGQSVSTPRARVPRSDMQVRTRRTGEWAVIAAIYKEREPAARRAERLAKQWQGTQPEVVPPVDGARRYMVVLGSGLSKEEATRLRERAVSSGMPRDSYVTKLSW